MTLNEINTSTVEGRLLMAAMTIISVECRRNDESDTILNEVAEHADKIYDATDLPNVNANNFPEALEQIINKYSIENGSNTPDYILAEYMVNCLNAFNTATSRKESLIPTIKIDQHGLPENAW